MKPRIYIFIILLAVITAAYLFWGKKNQVDKSDPADNITSQLSEVPAAKRSEPDQISTSADTDQLLPDMQVKSLSGAYILTSPEGIRTLRFPGMFTNTGDGPLELAAAIDEATQTTRATQIIHKKDGSKIERLVGNFVFHPTHSHWHFEDFVEFAIYSLKDGRELDQSLASTGKITFCLHDYAPLPEAFPGKPDNIVYPWCSSRVDIQGISVGWVDTYQADVPGQELDVSNIPDGIYAFRSVVDPDNRIEEKEENNNTTITYFEIAGNDIRLLESP